MIKGNVSLGTIAVIVGDTALLNQPAEKTRTGISAFSLHNTTGASVTVDVFVSPDLTSVSGQRIAQYAVAANASERVAECIGQSYPQGQNLIAVGTDVGVNASLTGTEYTNGS